jgi:hypothetical protein
MEMEREILPKGANQARWDNAQMADWVNWLAPWEVIAHLTWKDRIDAHGVPYGISMDSARKAYERFMQRELPRVSYFYAIEPNPSRAGCHVHALWADAKGVYRQEAWAAWFQRYGRARIEPVRSQSDVSDYCAKHLVASYTTKAPVWWNVKLQWHRVQAQHGTPFALEGSVRKWNQSTGTLPRECEQSRRTQEGATDNSPGPAAGCASTPLEASSPAPQSWRMVSPGIFCPC